MPRYAGAGERAGLLAKRSAIEIAIELVTGIRSAAIGLAIALQRWREAPEGHGALEEGVEGARRRHLRHLRLTRQGVLNDRASDGTRNGDTTDDT